MPSLTLNTATRHDTPSQSVETRSESPSSPPYSPITPTSGNSYIGDKDTPRPRFAHSQTTKNTISPPPTEPINFDENPDVLALKSTISILQMQKATATRDIKKLQRIKMRALENPREFTEALVAGDIKMRPDPLFKPNKIDDQCDDVDEVSTSTLHQFRNSVTSGWEELPTPQNIVRAPPINFAQYAIVSESLDKLHADQISRPSEGNPQLIGPDGEYIHMGEGKRRQFDTGIAAPYLPSKDKIGKAGKQ